jgi:hypothetical protein
VRHPPALAVVALIGLVLAAAPWVAATDWGLIDPGTTTMDAVRARYGAPTRTSQQKVEGYDVTQWIYEGAQAPAGISRMTVDFGLLTEGSFRAQVVRSMLLQPKPGVFNRDTILRGWGPPAGVGRQGDAPAYMYAEGLFVYFAPDEYAVTSMLFTPRQAIPAAPGPPPR